ncbi:alpha/beta hydrolase fold domain-containing protein [Bacillus mobilis]
MTNRQWRKNGPILSTENKRGYFDIPYGTESEAQKLDIWLPEKGDGPFPVILSIHGGGFVACDKRQKDMIDPMLEGLNRGYAVVSINYRLIGEVIFPEPVKDVKMAIRFIKKNAAKFHLVPNRVVTWGGSAGGYMALMTAVFENETLFDNEKDPNIDIPADVSAVVAWYPISDFSRLDYDLQVNSILRDNGLYEVVDRSDEYEDVAFPISKRNEFPYHTEDNVVAKFVGGPVNQLTKQVERANPISYIHKDMPKALLQHGSGDDILPMQQSIDFTLKVNGLLGKDHATVEIFPNAIHSSVMFETKENIERIFAFIDSELASVQK